MRTDERRDQCIALSRFQHALVLVGASGLMVLIALPAIATMNLKAGEPQQQAIADGIVASAGNLNASDGKQPMGLMRAKPAMSRVIMDIVYHRPQLTFSSEARLIEVLFEERMFLQDALARALQERGDGALIWRTGHCAIFRRAGYGRP